MAAGADTPSAPGPMPGPETAISDARAAAETSMPIPRIVADPLTGVALDGMDPVTYFCEPTPQQGSPDFEFVWGGVSFYFANAANRDVFIRAPQVYAPVFGGHDVMSLARGFLSDGNPNLYVKSGNRLLLFYSAGNRDAFLLAQQSALKQAEANWPALSKNLLGTSLPQASLIAW